MMMRKYETKKVKNPEMPEAQYHKLKLHRLTWLTLIFTLMFEHYQCTTWMVLFFSNNLVKVYSFCIYVVATPSAWIYLYRVEKFHVNPIFLVGYVEGTIL